jgi:hypothetical protein
VDATRVSRYSVIRPATVVYYDQPHLISHSYHHDYRYRDHHGLLCSRIVWPSYCFGVYYNSGPWFSFRYVWPYYHRRYVFVSLGGYWPISYRYRRYYWYGCHPYYWYGYYPIAREVQGDTYNYYTYNYYNDGQAVQTSSVVDPSIYQNRAQRQAEPAEQTLADTYFEEAVTVFEAGNYSTAVEKFARAMELAPNDMILPFAYSQALVANGQYPEAAQILRDALAKVSPDKEGVFYPRGLYLDEKTLLAQIDELGKKTELFSSDADLQLLLGYQLLGIGQTDQALAPLMFASKDMVNADAANVLLKLLEKVKAAEPENKSEDAPEGEAQSKAPQIKAPCTISSPVQTKTETIVATEAPDAIEVEESGAIVKADTVRFKEAMFLTSLCALGAGAGIRCFVHV